MIRFLLKWSFPAILLTVSFHQPLNKTIESYYYYGFDITTPSVSIPLVNIETPEVVIRHIPSLQNITQEALDNTINKSLPVNFQIGRKAEVVTAIIQGAINLNVTDVGQVSYILATAQHESANFTTLVEIGNCDYFANKAGGNGYVNRMGNLSKEDACKYIGRGLVQLTGKNNYKKISSIYNVNAVQNPDIIVSPDVSVTLLIEGMMGGWFTGKSLPQYVSGDQRDYVSARRVVNGKDRAHHIAMIAKNYEALVEKTFIEYGVLK